MLGAARVGPDGRPHARPVDGVGVDGALCFGGSPATRWVRNLLANPAISVHLSSEAEAIILEGTAEVVTDPAHPLAAPCMAASREKYPQYYSAEMPFREHSFSKFSLLTTSRATGSHSSLCHLNPAAPAMWPFS